MIQIDKRERKNNHITKYFNENNIEYFEKSLAFGDYANTEKPHIVVEKKSNIAEIATNLAERDRDGKRGKRILREFAKLDQSNGKMFFLIEEKFESMEDICNWKGKYSRLEGKTIFRYLVSWEYKHNIEYVFCNKNNTGKVIAQLLGVE